MDCPYTNQPAICLGSVARGYVPRANQPFRCIRDSSRAENTYHIGIATSRPAIKPSRQGGGRISHREKQPSRRMQNWSSVETQIRHALPICEQANKLCKQGGEMIWTSRKTAVYAYTRLVLCENKQHLTQADALKASTDCLYVVVC